MLEGRGAYHFEEPLHLRRVDAGYWKNRVCIIMGRKQIVEGKLTKAAPETVTLSFKVPVAMKRAPEKEAKVGCKVCHKGE